MRPETYSRLEKLLKGLFTVIALAVFLVTMWAMRDSYHGRMPRCPAHVPVNCR